MWGGVHAGNLKRIFLNPKRGMLEGHYENPDKWNWSWLQLFKIPGFKRK